jgi:ADP-heptose:LPS heptosyltransferase
VQYPGTRLSVICGKGISAGIRSLKLFDHVYVVNDDNFITMVSSAARLLLQLQRRSKLWIVDLEPYSKITGILSSWTFAINRFGFYFNQVAFRYNLYTHKVYFNTVINVEDNYKQMAIALGAPAIQPFTIPGYPLRTARKKYSYIAINNTCSELARERLLTAAQLKYICNWILEHTQYKIALLGAPNDKDSLDQFINSNNLHTNVVINIAGKYSFEDYYAFLYDECVAMITVDSAPLHIANKLNIPNLSIWGPTAPQSRIDTTNKNTYLYLGVTCSPCTHFVDNLPCNGNNFCIKNISNNLIVAELKKLLAHNEPN